MAEKRHHYRTTLDWSDIAGTGKRSQHTRNHVVRVAGKPDLLMSSDPSFRGDPARHNPEDLLVISLSSCHALWYLGLCAGAGIVVTRYVDEAEGEMIDTGAQGGRFASVTLHPRVTITAGDADRARALHHDAHRLCFIANSVNFPVSCEPVIETAR